MDVLSNISCCFDASKDIAETGVELVVCDMPVSKRCCIKWEIFTHVAAVIFSVTDFVADVCGFVAFDNTVEDRVRIELYIDVWLGAMVVSGVLIISEIALPIYSIVRIQRQQEQSEEEDERFRTCNKYWGRFNNVSVILSEDGVVAVARILIAFNSEKAISELQTVTGKVTSCITFGVTLMRHCLLMSQIITKLSKNEVHFSKCPPCRKGICNKGVCGFFLLFFFTLFLSCLSIALTGMSMTISLDLMDIHLNDDTDFMLNVFVMSFSVPLVYVFSIFLIILTRW